MHKHLDKSELFQNKTQNKNRSLWQELGLIGLEKKKGRAHEHHALSKAWWWEHHRRTLLGLYMSEEDQQTYNEATRCVQCIILDMTEI